jgi:surface polysaccharide O-acyltransferase-like enzyme
VIVVACAVWLLAHPGLAVSVTTCVASISLLALCFYAWHHYSDKVELVNGHHAVLGSAHLQPGIWIVVGGGVLAATSSLWALRVRRLDKAQEAQPPP